MEQTTIAALATPPGKGGLAVIRLSGPLSETILKEGGYEGQSSQLIYGMPNSWKPELEAQILDTVKAIHDTMMQK